MPLSRRRAAAETDPRAARRSTVGLRVTLWVGIILAAAAGATFLVAMTYTDWTGFALLMFTGALLFVSGIAGGAALLASAQRGAVFARGERILGMAVTGLVALALGAIAFAPEQAGIVYRLAFGLLALLDLIAIGALVRVTMYGTPPRWTSGRSRPQRHS